MRYAVIAAGEGSRLAAEGVEVPKPLVRVGGERLIDRLFRIFMEHDAEEIVVICNDKTAQVARHLVRIQRDGLRGRPIPLRFVMKTTPSSMHSFYEISQFLKDGPFVLTTVDTVFSEQEFSAFMSAFQVTTYDGLMGVTDYVDDESPLYVDTNENGEIKAFLDESATCKFISAGIYGLHENAIPSLYNCIARHEQRMRNFQRGLLADGRRLTTYRFSKVFDIDHAVDIQKAEEFLKTKKNG